MTTPHILDYFPNQGIGELPFNGISISHLKEMPKFDLHRHLIGAIRPEVLVYIANKLNLTLPTFGNDAERISKASVICKPTPNGYSQFLHQRIWGTFKEVFSRESGVTNAIYWAIADAARDGVCYVEFRVSPYGREFNLKLQLPYGVFLESLEKGIQRAHEDFPETLVKIVLSVGREAVVKWWGDSAERGRRYDKLIAGAEASRHFVVGFDITGDEVTYPNRLFVDFADKVKWKGFRLTVHAGETGDPNSVHEAVNLLNADRIGHGLGAIHDEGLMESLAERKIPLEICPTSNLMLGVVPSLKEHPCRVFLENKLRISINTDDPVLLGPTSQSAEFYRMICAQQITFEDIRQISEHSIEASFASEQEKAELRSIAKEHLANNCAHATTG